MLVDTQPRGDGRVRRVIRHPPGARYDLGPLLRVGRLPFLDGLAPIGQDEPALYLVAAVTVPSQVQDVDCHRGYTAHKADERLPHTRRWGGAVGLRELFFRQGWD